MSKPDDFVDDPNDRCEGPGARHRDGKHVWDYAIVLRPPVRAMRQCLACKRLQWVNDLPAPSSARPRE